jgi:hypothetical protein
MLQEVWIYIATFLASAATLLAGFGLATILTPVFAIVYEVKLAILLVAIVHFLNNILKFLLFRRHINKEIFNRFGYLSIFGALAGALLQASMYSTILKILLGITLVILGMGEFLPKNFNLRLSRKADLTAGFLSGFLGGLIGNQGAIRSAYLLKYELGKEEFIGTSAVIALTIDVVRIPIYLRSQLEVMTQVPREIVLVVLCALFGTFIGKQLLRRFSSSAFRKIVAASIVAVGIAFVAGILS